MLLQLLDERARPPCPPPAAARIRIRLAELYLRTLGDLSRAVAASGALPMIYKPVKVKERELVDGGIVSTTNLDIAVEAGAKFIVVVNPLVPYVNDFSKTTSGPFGTRARRISDGGFPQIGYQSFKLLAYQRLHEVARQWEQRYPGDDILLEKRA